LTATPAAFFATTFVLATPFYILNAFAYLEVLGDPGIAPIYIALFTVTPIAAASLLTFRQRGKDGLKQLIWRILDFKRIGNYRWYGAILLLPLLIALLSLGGSTLFGVDLPSSAAPLAALPLVLSFFFVLAAGEEAGWMGYAFDPMQARYGALRAALALGVVWTIWHVPFFIFMMPEAIVFTAQVVTLMSTRVLIAWVYNNSGRSVFAATLFHAVGNALMITLPDTSTTGALVPAISCGLVLSAVIIVTLLWGPQTLARYRFGNQV
jgi:membrane protease YdiL (CAAX protease family)